MRTAGVPNIGFHLAEELVVHHHSRAARLVVVQMDEAAVAEFPAEIRNVLRKDVRVDVDGEQLGHGGG
jgi:hypothetical protein